MLNVYGTNEAMVQALKTGQIDVATRVPPEVVKDLQANPAITVAVKPDLYLNEIAINVYQFGKQNPTLRDKSVRQAMAYAVNKTALLDLVLLGYGQVGDTLVFGPTPWHSTELNLFEFDLAKANAILDEAGYTNRDANGIRESKDGTKLEYTLNVVTDLPKQLRAGEMIRDWWNQIGIKLNVLLTDPGTIASLNLGSTGTEFAHDMFLWSWTGGGNLDPTFQLFIPTSMGIGSVSETGYNDTQYDQLYYQQMVAPDDAQRKQIVDKMQEVVYRDVPYIVLYYPSSIDGWRNDRWENVPEIATGSGGSIVIHAKLPLFVFMITPMTAPAATSTYTAIYLGVALVAASLVVVALYMRKRIKARKS